jgi:hypothetical protein
VNEAIAAAYLETSLREATAPSARAVLQELLADEVIHARSGWVYASGAMKKPALRDAIEEHVPALVRTVVGCWWGEDMLLLPEGVPTHGLPSVRATRETALVAVLEIVLPGFEALGIDVAGARTWTDRASPESARLPDP